MRRSSSRRSNSSARSASRFTGHERTAIALAAVGVFILVDVRRSSDSLGLLWAFLNGALFVGSILLGHKIAEGGVERLGAAMAAAFLFIMPVGLLQASGAVTDPMLLLAGIGVGVCSSVIPYVCDQLAMSRLPRASFALLLALLPAIATIVGAVALAQVPQAKDVLGVLLVMVGVAAPCTGQHPTHTVLLPVEPSDGCARQSPR